MRIQCVECKNATELKILDVNSIFFLKGCCNCLFEDCEKIVEMLVLLLLTK